LQSPSNAECHEIPVLTVPTGGKLFDDGAVIELVESSLDASGLALLKWDGREAIVGRAVEHDGRMYTPLTLHPTLRRALRLPSSAAPIDSTSELFDQLVSLFRRFTDLPEHACTQIVTFVLSTWLADCLPVPISLSLWSPHASEAAQVLRLLSSMCRLAIPLSGTKAQDLGLIPMELPATLLIFRPASGRRTLESLSSCGWRGFYTARSGELGQFVGSLAFSTDAPLQDACLDPVIEIALPPSRRPLPFLDERAQAECAREFLPKLLQYRLVRSRARAEAKPGETWVAGRSNYLAAGLRACLSHEPHLLDQQLDLLEVEQTTVEMRLSDPRVVLIEALWARCHEAGRTMLHVADIAADMNAIFSASGNLELSSRMAGALLHSIGLKTTKLDRRGRGVKLDGATRTLIHRLAQLHDVPSAKSLFPGCSACSLVRNGVNEGFANE
jgi:hypothetical protein